MLKEVFKRYGFDTNDDNVADAFCLMQLGRALTNTQGETALLVHQKDVHGLSISSEKVGT